MKTYVSFGRKKTININGPKTKVSVHASVDLTKCAKNEVTLEFIKENEDLIKKILGYSGLDSFTVCDVLGGHYCIIMNATASATCYEGDTYDRVKGINIADTRAQKKIFNAVSRIWSALTEKLEKMYVGIYESATATEDVVYSVCDHENDLIF